MWQSYYYLSFPLIPHKTMTSPGYEVECCSVIRTQFTFVKYCANLVTRGIEDGFQIEIEHEMLVLFTLVFELLFQLHDFIFVIIMLLKSFFSHS